MFRFISIEELLKKLENYNHAEFHIHHTYKPDHAIYNSRPDGLYWQEAMRRYHVDERGWRDIAQHITILPDGKIVTGRDFSMNPASIRGYNNNVFMVEMIGNFDIGRDPFDGPQRQSALLIAKWFDLRGRYIRFHNENSSKSCPGTSINKQKFIADVRGVTLPENGNEMAPLLQTGSRGEAVKTLQINLNLLGYNAGPEDGIFGPLTKAAVIAFQKDKGLVQDGIYGPKTSAAMEKALDAYEKDKGHIEPETNLEEIQRRVDSIATRLNELMKELEQISAQIDNMK